MAGGLGRRLKMGEKALVRVAGRSMISWVLRSLRLSRTVSDVYVATTRRNKATIEWSSKNGLKTIITSGKGYENDVVEVVELISVPVLVVVVDLPLIKSETLDQFVFRSLQKDHDVITLAVPAEQYLRYGSARSLAPVFSSGRKVQPVGVSLFKRPKCETWTTIVEEMRIEFLNVNTIDELAIANRVLLG